jgi:hypothetical protein
MAKQKDMFAPLVEAETNGDNYDISMRTSSRT